jgi:uncharacterized protein
MTEMLRPGLGIDALATPIALAPLPADQVESGTPSAGFRELHELHGGVGIGVWEHTPGVSTDVETEEVFVVLAGRATVEFIDSGEVIDLIPGVVVRLAEGAATRWTVTDTLRKIYIS